MLFNSLSFVVFFPIVTVAFFLCPQRHRWLLLLVASCYFYVVFIPVYILILLFTITVDYVAGIAIEGAQGRRRRAALIASIIANLGMLAVFKYLAFLNDDLAALARFLDWNYPMRHLSIVLPIGLSFHTFQALSYTVEVYRGRQRAERHFGIFALYVMFYPQLVAGPIERPQHLLPQLREPHHFEYQRVADGLKLMALGFLKKVVIADNFALVVNRVYDAPAAHDGLAMLVATICFAYQIYYDFAGYSDIAIGAAQVMGFELVDNFKRPYGARTVSDFWRRWHVSLSSWFRDYVYIPFGGNRVTRWRWYGNLLGTFVVSGFWHGANWTFLIWGALHGSYVLLSIWTQRLRRTCLVMTGLDAMPALHGAFRVATTFSLVTFAWIFFRANSVSDALHIVGCIVHSLASFGTLVTASAIAPAGVPTLDLYKTLPAFAAMGFVEAVSRVQPHGDVRHLLAGAPRWMRWLCYYLLVMFLALVGIYGPQQFIYFQF